MNPGKLDTPIQLERPGTERDELGQLLDSWEPVGHPLFATRIEPRIRPELVQGDRETERQSLRLRVRSQPFLSIYEAGQRVREQRRTDIPEKLWSVTGWTETPYSKGMYVDISVDDFAERG